MDSFLTPKESSGPDVVLEARSKQRPWSVTLLMLGVLIITIINLIRFVLSIRYWDFLTSRLGGSPIYLTLSGFLWSAAGMFLIWGLYRAKTWAPMLLQAVTLTYVLYYWLDHIFLVEHSMGGASGATRMLLPSNWRFSAAVTVVSLVYMVWTLSRPKVKGYFSLVSAEIQQNQGNADS